MSAHVRRQVPVFFDRTRDIVDAITLTVAKHFGADLRRVRSSTRVRRFARVRMVSMYLASTLAGLGPVAIGDNLGRDHSTVIHGLREIETLLPFDPFLRRNVAACTEKARAALALLDHPHTATT